MTDDELLPVDPDWDDVPMELRLLAGLGPATVICEDGVSRDQLVIVPSMFAHARRLREDAEN